MKDSAICARFFAKVDKTPTCWNWTGAHDRKGYGRFSVGGSRNPDGTRRNAMVAAHRFSYELANGVSPAELFVLHRCDNPRCVRPDHLFLGTNADNVRDMDSKGRRISRPLLGSAHALSILDEEQVREIVRRHRDDGISQAQLSRDFGVCAGAINHIFTGRTWAHLGLFDRS